MNKVKGFTIVELLVVIVVIGILASITVVSYNNIQNRALNTSRIQEVTAWVKHFELYKATFGTYPPVPNENYCLGVGFPDGDGIAGGECESFQWNNPDYRHHEIDNTALMNELKKVGSLPDGPKKPVATMVGAYAYVSSSEYVISQVFHGDPSECPPPMSFSWHNGGKGLLCYISSN